MISENFNAARNVMIF